MKKSIKRFLGVGMASLCLMALLSACGGKATETKADKQEGQSSVSEESKQDAEQTGEKKQFVIGMSQCNLGEPWRVAMNDQIKMAAEKHPEFKVIYADAAQDNSKQIADIQNFIQQKVDLIITSPNEATPLTNVVKEAYEAGIPVILLDRKIDGDTYTQFIGADNVDMGKVAGEYVANTLLKDGGKVCEIKGLQEELTETMGLERELRPIRRWRLFL